MDAEAWRAAKGVLAEALSCPPAERDAFVDAHCADPELRREVRAYLNEYDEHFLESVLSVSSTLESTSTAAADAAQLPEVQNGDHIGPYVVLDRLGAGGMGHVFLGNDTRLHRKVALKCLSASASAGELRSRILHEARAAARITHPNIAIVHDVVEHESRPFLVMEYVEGENLAAVIKRERPSIDGIVSIVRQLASALAAAHAKGIVHRDLKPANIQMMPDGSVKILDFGVAHAMSAAAVGVTSSSSAGPTGTLETTIMTTLQGERRVMHPGTPAYMSPEQMFGRPIDQRSDIYSLGVIVYEMATGHRPYATDDPLEVVLTLSRNFLSGETSTKLPAQISDIVSKMLAVRPEDRYQTAGELENALIELVAPAREFAADQPRSRLGVAARGAVITVSVLAGVTVLGYIETAAFNSTLGRIAPFDRESPAVWLKIGAQSLVLPVVYTVLFFIALVVVRFVVRLLRLSRGVDHLLNTSATRTSQLTSRVGLDDPLVLGQAVAGGGAIVLAVLLWHFWPFILAWGTQSISTQPAQRFLPLQPIGEARLNAQLYRLSLAVLIFVFGVAMTRINRLRAARAVGTGGAALAIVSVMFAISVLLCQAPYRIVWKNDSNVIDLAGERCFTIGESGGDWLVHCPSRVPPRNRVVRSTDPDVRATGLVQNIFTPPETLR